MVSRLVNFSPRLIRMDQKLRKESSCNFISDSSSFSDFLNALSGENGRSEMKKKNNYCVRYSVFPLTGLLVFKNFMRILIPPFRICIRIPASKGKS
jgi:hypothetical protein